MSALRRNVLANFAGTFWTSVISLVLVPVYIHFLGIEAWGLIGFYVTLQGVLTIGDMGLSTTLNREMARASAGAGAVHQGDLLRTLEVLYWSIAVLLGVGVVLTAPLVATRWLHVQHLPVAAARQAVALMGLVVILQFPLALYTGGLLGLQQQIRLNAINVAMATIRSLGMVVVLTQVSPTLTAYFLWQLAMSGAHTAIAAMQLWRSVGPADARPRFRREVLATVWRFSAGITGIGLTGVLLTQVDKIVLSAMLPLDAFGYYVLAAALAAGLNRLVNPIFLSCFPGFTKLVAQREKAELQRLYHAASQLATVVLAPIAAVAALFSYQILVLWTRNAVTADRAYVSLTLLIVGTTISGLMFVPYALQLAHGWIRLTLWTNTIASLALVPLVFVLASQFAGPGAAMGWLVFNLVSFAVTVPIVHRRLLPGTLVQWYVDDVGRPLAAAMTVVVLARLTVPFPAGAGLQMVSLGATLTLAAAAAIWAAPLVRSQAAAVMATVLMPAMNRRPS